MFRDRHDRLKYLKACEVACRIAENPSLIEDARTFLVRMAADPHQRDYVEIWREMLERPPAEIAAALVEDSERGDLLQDTAPVFGPGFTSQEIVRLIEGHASRP